MKNKTHYFLTDSGCIHAYYPDLQKTTFDSNKNHSIVVVGDEVFIKFNNGQQTFVLFESLAELVNELKGLNNIDKDDRFFVDCDGVFHRFNLKTNESTYLTSDSKMKPHIEKVEYLKGSYERISFIDPAGLIEDTEAYVLWDDLQNLANEIEK